MMTSYLHICALLLLIIGKGGAFTVPSFFTVKNPHSAALAASESDSLRLEIPSRRQIIGKALLFVSSPALLSVGAAPAIADVSDGNALPQGAAQFGRIVRAKSDLAAVQKRVALNASEMDKNEWNNIGQFLRKVYSVSEDMKAIASSFYETDKKKKAAELIDDLKKYSKAADASTGAQNGPEFLPYAKKLSSILDDFLELLRDVPDEI